MKCFQHAEADAVAICRSCGKALCHTCTVENEGGVSCQGTCQQRTSLYLQLLQGVRKEATVYRRLGVVFLLMAILAMAGGLWLPDLVGDALGEDGEALRVFGYLLYGIAVISFIAAVICWQYGSSRRE